MKTILNPSRGGQGSALVLTIVVTGLVGFVLLAYLSLVKAQNVSTARSQLWNAAVPIMEGGIEDALAHLNSHGTTNLSCDGWYQAGNLYCIKRSLGDGYYVTIISNWMTSSNAWPIIDSRAFITAPLFASRSPDWMLAAAGVSGGGQNILARGVRVKTRTQGLFTKAMVAKGTITFNGQASTDSFRSDDPNYSTDGQYDPAKWKDNGDVASNGVITNAVSAGGNVKIYGHVSTGPKGTVGFTGGAVAGSKDFVDSGTNSGVQAGWCNDDMNVTFPDPPPQTFTGRFAIPQNQIYNGTNYDYLMGSGRYYSCGVSMSSSKRLMVTGKADLYVQGDFKMSGQSSIVIAPGASLTLWAGGGIAFAGQGVYNETGNAANCVVYGLPSCKSITMGGNAAFIGVFYAPYAALDLTGGGTDPVDFIGASITSTVKMGGHYKFHYDETLADRGPIKGFTVTGWDEMTPQQATGLPPGVAAILGEY
jgi:hypothetical protein